MRTNVAIGVLMGVLALAGWGCGVSLGMGAATTPGAGGGSSGPSSSGGGGAAAAGGGGVASGGGADAIQVGSLFVRLGPTPAEVESISTCGAGGAEVCGNAIDDNCDGTVDETCAVAHTNFQNQPPSIVQGGAMQFTLAWNSESDMSMTIIEPDEGELPSTEGRTTDNGGEYQIAVNSACTDQAATKEENVRYTRSPRFGTYKVRVAMDYLCSAPRARANLSLAVGGRVVGAYHFVLDERNEMREFLVQIDDQ